MNRLVLQMAAATLLLSQVGFRVSGFSANQLSSAGRPSFSSFVQEDRNSHLAPSWQGRLATSKLYYGNEPVDHDYLLDSVAKRLRLQVFDLDEEIVGLDSKDPQFGLEVVSETIQLSDEDDSLGLGLVELASGSDRRGLVLIDEVMDKKSSLGSRNLQVGDVLTGIAVPGTTFQESLTALNYDATIEVLNEAKEAALRAPSKSVKLEVNRLVKRAHMKVVVRDPNNSSKGDIELEGLAGENLRLLLQRHKVNLYNPSTKRYDQPFSTGNCGGEGICGTCLVSVLEGQENLSPKEMLEKRMTKDRPASWRMACRAIVGPENKPGTVVLSMQPQTGHPEEIDPGVRPL